MTRLEGKYSQLTVSDGSEFILKQDIYITSAQEYYGRGNGKNVGLRIRWVENAFSRS